MKLHLVAVLSALLAGQAVSAADPLDLPLRTRVQPFKGADLWKETAVTEKVTPAECAVVLCDIWDKHWCENATTRCGELAPVAEAVAKKCRDRGMFVIHCPSDTMDYYKDSRPACA